jgi:hypothetical protein
MSAKKNELATSEPMLPAPVIDYGADAGSGVSDIGRDEAGIPFLKILQAQSPEVIGPNGKIEGASAGNLLNTGTEILSDEITIVPACRQHVFVEWRPRKQGGGIVAIHQKNSEIVAASIAASEDFGKYKTEEGNDLVETFYVYSVVLEDDSPTGFIVVPFSSTGIKKYKKSFINRVRYCVVDNGQGGKVTPPMFAHRVTVGTVQESNDDGTWSNYDIKWAVDNNVVQSLMTPDHAGFAAAKELKAMVESGEAVADTSKAGDSAKDEGDDAEDSAF